MTTIFICIAVIVGATARAHCAGHFISINIRLCQDDTEKVIGALLLVYLSSSVKDQTLQIH